MASWIGIFLAKGPRLVGAGVFCVGILSGVALGEGKGPATGAATQAVGNPFEGLNAAVPETPLDKLVFANLAKQGIEPANVCSDAVFVRRVFLDVIGTLPTSQETKDFLADHAANKRSVLIDRLLERDEFVDYWAMKWSDLLRVKAEFPIDLWPAGAQAYHRWIRDAIRTNKPYDQFARELLTSSGSNFRDPPVNFFRALQSKDARGIAQGVALTFMGTRTESWPKGQWDGMAGFFAQVGFKETKEWKEVIVYWNTNQAATTAPATLPAAVPVVFPDGTPGKLSPDRDPRVDFANWLLAPRNPWFARNIANRAWSWFLGRGIIHEPDDIRPDNPAVNPELLAYLEHEVVAGKYDLKHLYRVILNSRTYQLSSIPKSTKPQAEANFAQYPLRRLEAEVLIDAVDELTGSTEKYSSIIPEPFTFVPEEQRTIALADGSISSPFLEMFGRPARDTGWESERNNKPSSQQALHLLNSSHIQRKLDQSAKIQALTRARSTPRETVTELYVMILSRYPTDNEIKIATAGFEPSAAKRREAVVDVAWALLNSSEFLYRH